MVFLYTAALSAASIVLMNHHHSAYIILATIFITALYYLKIYTDTQSKFLPKLKNGQFFHQVVYLIWVSFLPRHDFIFFLPLILSNVGKIYSIFHENCEDNQNMIEQLIKFQAKLELFLGFILLIKLLNMYLTHVIVFITFAVICKIKYTFYFPCQKAYVELHFSIDNMSKRWGARKIYHFIHGFLSFFGGVRNDSKEIAY